MWKLTFFLKVVVVFRGTDDLENWITDLESAVLTSYKNMSGIEVGLGFYKEWNDLMPQVLPAVQSLAQKYPSYKIWVTGHSLGAAISILCAAELAQQGYSDISVYNFGLPRVGNENFSNYYRTIVSTKVLYFVWRVIIKYFHLGTKYIPSCKWSRYSTTCSIRSYGILSCTY